MVARDPDLSEPSTARLLQELSEETSRLIRDELAMARMEMQERAKRVGIGVGFFGASGLLVLFGCGALVATAIIALSLAVEPWLAALIVAAALFLTAGLVGLTGKKQVEGGTPPLPERTIENAKLDVKTVKEASGGNA